jgi:hypothetical protein
VSDNIFMAEAVQPVLVKDGGLFTACQGARLDRPFRRR